MDIAELLPLMRRVARRFAGAFALMFLCTGFAGVVPARAATSMPHAMHAAVHQDAEAPCRSMPSHHHGEGSCCLGAQGCGDACSSSLHTPDVGVLIALDLTLPRLADGASPISRPHQPPLRPPRA